MTVSDKTKFWAWCSKGITKKQLLAARDAGITGLDYMVNDLSSVRSRVDFSAYSATERDLALIQDSGFEVSVTSWVIPDKNFLAHMCEDLLALSLKFGLHSICLDAEEPWSKSRCTGDREKLAEYIDIWMLGHRWSVTGIASMPESIKPLVLKADVKIPQLYRTKTQQLSDDYMTSRQAFWSHFTTKPVSTAVGLALYSQMVGSKYLLKDTLQWLVNFPEHFDHVEFWALRHLTTSPTAVRMLSAFTRELRE